MAATYRDARLPNTTEWLTNTPRGDYLVQVAWPLSWSEDRIAPENEVVNTLYLVDGNAYFFSAVDATRRLEYLNSTRTVVVGVGYPPGKLVFDFRRGPDLTPKAPEYDMPLDRRGNPRTDISFGEAEEFLDWIQRDVMTHVEHVLFPKGNLHTGRKALFGHSYGGIFALNTLYTSPTLFDTYIAASPIIWWNKDFLFREPESAFRAREIPVDPPRSLILTWGNNRDDLTKHHNESDDVFRKRQGCAEYEKIRENISALASRLADCPSIRNLQTREFENEDHGSVAVAALQHGITQFILETV